jgi:hypothetical protein
MSRQRNQRYPLNQPPDGMVVEPALPTRDPMTPSQTSVNNSLGTADDETLPPVRDAQGNPVPLTEFGGMTDDAPEDVPVEVRRATANVPAKGVHFNFQPFQQIAQLHAAGQTQEAIAMRDSLDPQSRYVYDNIKNMKKVPASEAARLADEFRQKQDRVAMQREDPLKQAQLADRKSKIAEREAVQNDFKIRRQATLKNIEEVLKDKDYASLVGPFDGTVGGMYDAAFNPKMQAKRAKLDRLINIDVLDMTKYLRPISQDELKYLRTLVPGSRQHWEVYEQYLSEKRDMLKAADKAVVNPATNQALPSESDDTTGSNAPAASTGGQAAPQQTKKVGNQTWVRTPDGWLPQR